MWYSNILISRNFNPYVISKEVTISFMWSWKDEKCKFAPTLGKLPVVWLLNRAILLNRMLGAIIYSFNAKLTLQYFGYNIEFITIFRPNTLKRAENSLFFYSQKLCSPLGIMENQITLIWKRSYWNDFQLTRN